MVSEVFLTAPLLPMTCDERLIGCVQAKTLPTAVELGNLHRAPSWTKKALPTKWRRIV